MVPATTHTQYIPEYYSHEMIKPRPVKHFPMPEPQANVYDFSPKLQRKSKSKKRGSDEIPDEPSSSSIVSESQENQARFKRSRLPANAVAIFRNWFFSHLESPYPSEEEKEDLANRAGLRITQVNNWFTNARRRILPRQDIESSREAGSKPQF
jgi:hypothetical protein